MNYWENLGLRDSFFAWVLIWEGEIYAIEITKKIYWWLLIKDFYEIPYYTDWNPRSKFKADLAILDFRTKFSDNNK